MLNFPILLSSLLLSIRTKNIIREPHISGKMSGSDENYPSIPEIVFKY